MPHAAHYWGTLLERILDARVPEYQSDGRHLFRTALRLSKPAGLGIPTGLLNPS